MKPNIQISLPTPYSDKVELIQKSLDVYKLVLGVPMTQRDKDILTLCFIYDLNDVDFHKKLLQANLGIDNTTNIKVLISRLKAKGFITQDPVKMKRKYLVDGLQKLKEAVMANNNITFNIILNEKQ